jgi:hypothetical protein
MQSLLEETPGPALSASYEADASSSMSKPNIFTQASKWVDSRTEIYTNMSIGHLKTRWVAFFFAAAYYAYRVFTLEAFHIVTYGLGIYLLNVFLAFITPLDENELDSSANLLPTSDSDEYRPFFRRLPEFKFWYACIRAVLLSTLLTFFSVFNVPVFWPILVVYFVFVFVLMMKKQIQHMIKYKYVPFSINKKAYSPEAGR